MEAWGSAQGLLTWGLTHDPEPQVAYSEVAQGCTVDAM